MNDVNNNSNEKKVFFNSLEVFIISVMICLISIIITTLVIKMEYSGKVTEKTSSELSEVEEIYNNIVQNYYGEIDTDKLVQGAISGMLSAVGDPYTTMMGDGGSNTEEIYLNGEYDGIGVMISNGSDNNIYITGIVNDSPASKSDLQLLDQIISINGIDFINKTTNEATSLIDSFGYEEFELVVLREEKEYTIRLQKDRIELKSVLTDVIEQDGKKIGYMAISIFALNTDEQLKKGLIELESKGIDSLIIDLRNNTGGHLTTVNNIVSCFLTKNQIMYNIEDNGVVTPYYSNGTKNKDYPIVVLTNGESASGSEVLAAALRDNLNTKIIGEKTFGKGTVQHVNTLSNGEQYKITTQKWLTPKKEWIHGVGLSPDIEMKLNNEYDGTYSTDNQLQAAIKSLSK